MLEDALEPSARVVDPTGAAKAIDRDELHLDCELAVREPLAIVVELRAATREVVRGVAVTRGREEARFFRDIGR